MLLGVGRVLRRVKSRVLGCVFDAETHQSTIFYPTLDLLKYPTFYPTMIVLQ